MYARYVVLYYTVISFYFEITFYYIVYKNPTHTNKALEAQLYVT